jgi:hypothetical protein
MVARALIALVVLYLVLDFTNPHMPGAVTFDPAKSIEGVHAERTRHTQPVTIAVPAPRPVRLTEVPARGLTDELPAQPPVRRWRTSHLERTPAPEPPAASEDH